MKRPPTRQERRLRKQADAFYRMFGESQAMLKESQAKLELTGALLSESSDRFTSLVNGLRVLEKDLREQSQFTARLSNVAVDVRDRTGAGGSSTTWKRSANLIAALLGKHTPTVGSDPDQRLPT